MLPSLDCFRDVDSIYLLVQKNQEAEAEKEGLVAQATVVMTQKTELGEAQKALQHQLNEVKALISEFEDKRAAFGVRLVLPQSFTSCINNISFLVAYRFKLRVPLKQD